MQPGARKPDWVVDYEDQQVHAEADSGNFMWPVEQACPLRLG